MGEGAPHAGGSAGKARGVRVRPDRGRQRGQATSVVHPACLAQWHTAGDAQPGAVAAAASRRPAPRGQVHGEPAAPQSGQSWGSQPGTGALFVSIRQDLSRASFRPASGPCASGRAGADPREDGKGPGAGRSGARPGARESRPRLRVPHGDSTAWTPFHVYTQYCVERGVPLTPSQALLDPRIPAVTVPEAWPSPCLGQPGAPSCLGLAAYSDGPGCADAGRVG